MIEKYKPLFTKILLYLFGAILVAALIFILYKFAIISLPFIIAIFISNMLEPIIQFILKRTKGKLNRKPVAIFITFIFLSTTGFLITKLIIKLMRELNSVYKSAAEYYNLIYDSLKNLILSLKDFYILLPEEITGSINNILQSFSKEAGNLLQNILESIFSIAGQLPSIILFVFVTILALFFLVVDKENIAISIKSSIPERNYERIKIIWEDVFTALGSYLKAMFIILMITFIELSIAFNIMGIKSAFVLALIISIFDILPVFGTGGFLVPWMAYEFITGNTRMGLSILVTYAIVWIIRQIIEPRIVGSQIGIPPFLTLFSMYLGYRIIGFSGMILGPIAALAVKTFFVSFKKLKIDLGQLDV